MNGDELDDAPYSRRPPLHWVIGTTYQILSVSSLV